MAAEMTDFIVKRERDGSQVSIVEKTKVKSPCDRMRSLLETREKTMNDRMVAETRNQQVDGMVTDLYWKTSLSPTSLAAHVISILRYRRAKD